METRKIIIEERLTLFLLMLQISPNLVGHDFLKDGAKKIIEDNSKRYNMGVGLYSELALEKGVERDLVDRAMRHAIDVSAKRNGLCEFERNENMSFSSHKPTPREMLCVLAEIAMRECDRILKDKEYAVEIW